MSRILPVLIIVLILVLISTSVSSACPNCSRAISASDSGEAGNAPLGFYYSILFMLSMPYLLLGGFSLMFYRLYQKAERQRPVHRSDPSLTY